jgi:hypothetical protein
MSNEQKQIVTTGVQWFLKIVFAILGFLLIQSFYEVKSDIQEISRDVKQIEGRLIRVETKLEK